MGRNLPYSIRQSALYRGTFCVSISPTAFSCHFLFMAVGLRWALSGSITSILTVLVEKTIFGFISRFPRFWQVNSGIFPQQYRPARPANIDTEECTLPCTWKCSRLWGVLKLSRGKNLFPENRLFWIPKILLQPSLNILRRLFWLMLKEFPDDIERLLQTPGKKQTWDQDKVPSEEEKLIVNKLSTLIGALSLGRRNHIQYCDLSQSSFIACGCTLHEDIQIDISRNVLNFFSTIGNSR